MNEFEKNQDKGTQTEQQGGKPAFGQLDKGEEQPGQQRQEYDQKGERIDQGQQEQEQGQTKRDELAGADRRDDIRPSDQGDKGREDDQNR